MISSRQNLYETTAVYNDRIYVVKKKTTPHTFAKGMFSIGAISISLDRPFVWSSGINAPLYCDHRLIISNVELRTLVVEAMLSTVKELYNDIEAIAGVSTGGVPYATWLAGDFDLPLLYVRPKAKSHGKMNFIEGSLEEGQKVLVVEDVLTTGGSAIKTSEIIREAGGVVVGVISIFDYQFKVLGENMDSAGLKYSCLYDFFDLIQLARDEKKLAGNDIDQLEKYIESPYQYYLDK